MSDWDKIRAMDLLNELTDAYCLVESAIDALSNHSLSTIYSTKNVDKVRYLLDIYHDKQGIIIPKVKQILKVRHKSLDTLDD